MAVAMTVDRQIALFEALDVPYATQFNTLDGMGALSSQTDISNSTSGQAKTAILAFVASLENMPSVVTVLNTYLDRWTTISTKVTAINGSIGEVSGVTYDYENERTLLAKRIQLLVPFYKWHEVLARQAGESKNKSTIEVIR